MPKNIKSENTKAKNPYARAKWLALVSMAGVATLLNIALQDWIASLHLAMVVVFTIITLGFAVHTLIVAIATAVTAASEAGTGTAAAVALAAGTVARRA